MDEIFYWLFNMSIVASLSGIIILLLRKLRFIPKRVIKTLWAIPLIRFWLPIGIGGKYGLMTLISKFTTKTVTLYRVGDDLEFSMTNSIMGANRYFPITYKVNILEGVFKTAAFVWIIIFIIILVFLIMTYIHTLSQTGNIVLHPKENVYISDKITSPAVFGIRRAKIILPSSYSEMDPSDLKYVIMHEKAHVRREDNLLRLIGFVTAALHWFNPLAWLFLKRFFEDTEFACDEAVLSKLDPDERKHYANALIDCAENKNMFISAFGGAKLRARIEHVLSFKKISVFSSILFAVLIAAIGYVLLTNAM